MTREQVAGEENEARISTRTLLAQSGLLPTEGAATWIGFENAQIEITRRN
jgi:hypothetical protein